jgi:hypothetical protein
MAYKLIYVPRAEGNSKLVAARNGPGRVLFWNVAG